MTLLGIKFSEMKIKEVITDYRVYIASALKLVAPAPGRDMPSSHS